MLLEINFLVYKKSHDNCITEKTNFFKIEAAVFKDRCLTTVVKIYFSKDAKLFLGENPVHVFFRTRKFQFTTKNFKDTKAANKSDIYV